jgi:hypothetical protein
MMRHVAVVLLLAGACGARAQVVAQTAGEARVETAGESYDEKARRVKAEEIDRVAETEFDRSRESAQQRAARGRLEREQGIRFEPLSGEERELLAPPQGAVAQHAAFLAQPDTGLVRLLPREKFDGKLAVRGGGAYYSFAHLVHEYNYGSDIGLEKERFGVPSAGAGYGFLFDLGDTALEEVTTETGPVKFLASFTPPAAEPEARKIQLRFHDGYQDGWFVYRRFVPAVAGHTYVVRAVDYNRSDVLVVFRVLSKDEDGVVLLWKMLKQFPATQLQRDAAQQGGVR